MARALGLSLLAVSLFGLTVANAGGTKEGTGETSLTLVLPASSDPPDWAKERVPKLTINGKDQPVKPGSARELTVKVTPPAGKDTITVVYSFWPYSYSNTIRTKEVKLNAKAVKVDFNVPDEKHADLIKPIYYPTPQAVAVEMCKMGEVGKDDIVYDIGCGDGRLVVTAVQKFGAKKGVGVDIDPDLVKLCKENAKKAGVGDKTEFRNENALTMKSLADATVVLLYVGEDFGKALEPVLRKTLKPGARIVSHRFPLGDWKPDVTKEIVAKNNYDMDEEYVLHLWKIK